MNIVDYVFIALVLLSAVRGWRRGFVGQAFEFGGGLLGLLAGLWLGPRIASRFTDEAGVGAAVISLIVVFVGLSIGQTVGYLLGFRFGLAARRANLGDANAALGAGTGVLVSFIAFWLVASLLIQGPSKPVAKALNRSTILDTVEKNFPRPPNVFAYIRQYLDTSGFPQVFAGFPRPIGRPAKLPSEATARRAIEAADQSTVRVVVPACGGTQLGTGWVAADSTIVTNAHVVAGGDSVTIEDANGTHSGVVVVFDPRTDVAVVRASGLAGPPLPLESSQQDDGTPGATLGFPGSAGGAMRVHRAAVQDSYPASGRDIYGRAIVERDVYELRSQVRQGDSGGPFVLPNGRVAGVVFAASTVDGDIGYALTGAEIADEVRDGSARTEPVGTGPCTR